MVTAIGFPGMPIPLFNAAASFAISVLRELGEDGLPERRAWAIRWLDVEVGTEGASGRRVEDGEDRPEEAESAVETGSDVLSGEGSEDGAGLVPETRASRESRRRTAAFMEDSRPFFMRAVR